MKIQQYNHKCYLDSGYICGDMTQDGTKQRILGELNIWRTNFGIKDPDVIIATPPCQGMSVANHKKKDELGRNSLVVESIKMVKELTPKFFVFENVSAFLKSICTDIDGADKTIKEAISENLGGLYNICARIVNFKDYGCPSSRTRTLVLGSRKDLLEVSPFAIFPQKTQEKTLRETIGHLPSLKIMGEISEDDVFHSFRAYAPHMEAWISELKEGQSAFDNTDISRIPHRIVDGVVVYNAQKNGDKYTRQRWDKVAPCIHTRNDILASQNTVHPADNRVFSIREVMLMMSVPDTFKWSELSVAELNKLSISEKRAFLKKEGINIRQTLGEAVPTIIFKQIAHNIRLILSRPEFSDKDAAFLIKRQNLTDQTNLRNYIKRSERPFSELAKIAELSNAERDNTAAYYTRQDICFAVVSALPDFKGFSELHILEPAVGVGNFLPTLFAKYVDIPHVILDVVDINPDSIELLKVLIRSCNAPANFTINYICADFLTYEFDCLYDVVVGNPPYMKLSGDKTKVNVYKKQAENKDTNNIFSFFIEKSLKIGKTVALIVPKSLINAPEFNATRETMNRYSIASITDFGEKAFKGVKIETVSFVVSTVGTKKNTRVQSYITNEVRDVEQSYITCSIYPYWLLYRNSQFDRVAEKLRLGVFRTYRDRKITKAITLPEGKVRVLKSRNIGNNEIIDIPNYDCFVNSVEGLDVAKFLNKRNCILIPNLTYSPRACMLPPNCITDGSVAILQLLDESNSVSAVDLEYFSTDEFRRFYMVARNQGSRSLNIDNNSVYFFGIKHK
ncbi:MAG: DNA cytosine methyltransferase [Bacteroides sp.]|nr:DNA cytosine methyltransferase [Roseburia sp.]MCM1345932.1 DNA cytosine methyltransferase [Bacteroides sp.]MCM1420296.1 DNA cytosine methyltransferase [Bacteroides sp.]